MLCVTEQDSVVMLGAVSDDAKFVWIRETITLGGDEHTHVLNCYCELECPEEWPLPTSRSYPIEYTTRKC
jgi:hypothetical protein